MTQSAKLSLSVAVEQAVSQDHSTTKDSLDYSKLVTLLNGTGADQANKTFHDQRTLTGSSNEDLDLAGSLTDAFGNTITFTKIKAIIVVPAAANGDTVSVGGAAANGFVDFVGAADDKIKVRPGGAFMLVAPDATAYAVTAGTADLLRITNDDASSATYDIIIVGVE